MFHVKISYSKKAQFKVELSQEGRVHSMQSDSSCQSYLNRVKDDLASNMALAVSSWGSSYEQMKWLDKETGCRGDCNNKPTLTIKNIAYNTAGHNPKPKPTNYDWGNPCNNKDGECANVDCMDKECKWSWPHTDPAKWKSKDAKCRCHKTKSQEFEEEEFESEDLQEEMVEDQNTFIPVEESEDTAYLY